MVRIGRRGRQGNGMADCDVVPAHEDLMHQQSYDSLTLCHFQDISSGAQSCAELGEVSTKRKLRVGSTAVISSDCSSASFARCCLRRSGMRQRSSSKVIRFSWYPVSSRSMLLVRRA